MDSVFTTWSELLEKFRARNEEEIHSQSTTAIIRIRDRNPRVPVSEGFLGVDQILSRVAILVGPQACYPVFHAQAAFFVEALAEEKKASGRKASALVTTSLLAYINVARCIGFPLPAELSSGVAEQEMALRAVNTRDELNEFDQEELAASCVALKLYQEAFDILEHYEPSPFVPGQVFGPNLAGLISYLCAASKSSVCWQDLEPAWYDLLTNAPRIFSAEAMSWSTFLWLARLILCAGGLPASEVALKIHSSLFEVRSK